MNVIKQRHLLDGNRVIVLLPQSLLQSADTLLIRNFGNHFLIGMINRILCAGEVLPLPPINGL